MRYNTTNIIYNARRDSLQLSQLTVVNRPISLGIIPSISFWSKFIEIKLVSNPISDGISPSKLFLERSRSFNPVSKPISDGIEPVRAFESEAMDRAKGSTNVWLAQHGKQYGLHNRD